MTRNLNEAAIKAYGSLIDGTTAFGELSVAEFTPLIELNSANGLSIERDVQTTANSGTIVATEGQFRLRTGTTANGSATLDTAERGRYQAGIVGLPGIGIRRPTAPTGNQFWEAGYFDANDGFRVGEDANGVYVRLRVGGTDKDKVYQADWNGESVTLDLTKPTVFRFPFVWYFGGPIEVRTLHVGAGGVPRIMTLHRFGPTAGEPIIRNANLPVRATVDNGGDTTSLDLFVGGRQFAVLGRYRPNRRTSSETRFEASLSGTTLVPLVSFRKKSGQEFKSVKVEGFDVLSADDLQVVLVLNGTLTGASYGALSNISAAETALEVDTTATAVSSGESIFERLVNGGNGNQTDVGSADVLDLDIPDATPITLAARKVSGAGGTATVTLRIREEW